MQLRDRIYGRILIEDAGILDLIGCPTFQRLKGVRQAGPSALAFPFKDVTRYEHSLGVFALLRRLRAPRREQVAGLLHDISHTAFSHAVDFVFTSQEQDHHEQLKPLMLERPDLARALAGLGYAPSDFFDDSIYPLLEQPIPWLCADRLDYFLRDGVACGVVTSDFVKRILSCVAVVDKRIVLCNVEVARQAAALFATMNRNWWASPTEAFIYNEFADVLREGLRLGVIRHDDLMTEDLLVLNKLEQSGSRKIANKLTTIRNLRPESTHNYAPRIVPKERWLDPPVLIDGTVQPLSELEREKRRRRRAVRALKADMMLHRRVRLGKVAAIMGPARFLAFQGGRDHQPGDDQHVLHGPPGRIVKFQRQDIAAPAIDLQGGLAQPRGVASDPHVPPHERT